MTTEKSIEVPAKWFEELLKISGKLDNCNIKLNSKIDAQIIGDLAQLLGYIESAKYLLKQNQ